MLILFMQKMDRKEKKNMLHAWSKMRLNLMRLNYGHPLHFAWREGDGFESRFLGFFTNS